MTRQLGIEVRAPGVNLVDVLGGRAGAGDAVISDVIGGWARSRRAGSWRALR